MRMRPICGIREIAEVAGRQFAGCGGDRPADAAGVAGGTLPAAAGGCHHPAKAGGGPRLFRFLLREGLVAKNVARLVRTPKAPRNCRKC